MHPFREGNGRALRAFFDQLARQAGFMLDNTRIDNSEGQWNLACEQSFLDDLSLLTAIFHNAIIEA